MLLSAIILITGAQYFQMPVVDYSIDDQLLSELKSLKDLVEQRKTKKTKPKWVAFPFLIPWGKFSAKWWLEGNLPQ